MHRLLPALAVAALALAAPSLAAASPPNDAFASATTIQSLPFSETVDMGTATAEPGEPQSCWFSSQTVWYAFTPAEPTRIRAAAAGIGVNANLNVYRKVGDGPGGLAFVACADFGRSLTFTAEAGQTYYFQAESLFGGFGSIRLDVEAILPPPNDDFASATVVPELGFVDAVDTTAATAEPGERSPCSAPPSQRTAWYAFTPASDDSITVSVNSQVSPIVAVYAGDALGALKDVVCRPSRVTFRPSAGTTYRIQVGSFGDQGGPMTVRVERAPEPQVSFFWFPADPFAGESVRFVQQAFDPGEAGIVAFNWSFGDATTGEGSIADHRYAVDGDYVATLEVVTADARRATASRTIQVRTHDATISRFSTPQSAIAGQTKSLSVGITTRAYTEVVQVQLFKSVAGSADFALVGTLQQTIPPRGGNKTVPYDFNYTFTADDAAAGKVTFKAVATLVTARDEAPADNTIVALPTKVGR